MAEVKELKWFNWLSISFGVGLFIDGSKFMKLVSYTRAFTVLLSAIYMLVIHVLNNMDNSYPSNNVFVINLSCFTYFLGVIFYTTFLNVSRREVSSILLSLFQFMTNREKVIMKRTSIAVTTLILVYFFAYTISSALIDESLILNNQIMDTLLFNQTNIHMHGCGLCFIFILSSFFCHQNILCRINQKISTSLDNITIHQIVLSLLLIQSNIKRMNRVCGPVLLLQFSTVFTTVPSLILLVTDRNGDYSWMITELYTIVAHILILLLLVVVVEKLTEKLHETRAGILIKMMGRNDIHHLNIDVNTFMKLLQDKNVFKYRAMNIFDISYSMLLTFLGSVISLSVLICQVNGSTRK